jgi:UDP:flavonoid glycosyltransferase YjiC (YdhE family)
MYAGVPMLVVPQGADQPMIAARVVELGAGLSIRTEEVTKGSVRALARRLLHEAGFRAAAATLKAAQHDAGGYRRAADELEAYVPTTGSVPGAVPGSVPRSVATDPSAPGG